MTRDLGFTPIELEQLLGKTPARYSSIMLQKKGAKTPSSASMQEFEDFFNFKYRSFLTFSSYLCLYQVICNCPYILRFPSIVKENYTLAAKYKNELAEAHVAPVFIKWIDPILGYGLFAAEDIPQNTFVGEYTGLVRKLDRKNPDHNAYCFHYPTKLWSWNYYVIDSLHEGNMLRFANHSNQPSMNPFCLVDRGLLHTVFLTSRDIPKGAQLTFDYGEDYWSKRRLEKIDI